VQRLFSVTGRRRRTPCAARRCRALVLSRNREPVPRRKRRRRRRRGEEAAEGNNVKNQAREYPSRTPRRRCARPRRAQICAQVPRNCQLKSNCQSICQTIGEPNLKIFANFKNAKGFCQTTGDALNTFPYYSSTEMKIMFLCIYNMCTYPICMDECRTS
jgi:hypothetical protein